MQFGNAGDQAEPETAAGSAAADIETDEALQNTRAVRRRDAWAGIGNYQLVRIAAKGTVRPNQLEPGREAS